MSASPQHEANERPRQHVFVESDARTLFALEGRTVTVNDRIYRVPWKFTLLLVPLYATAISFFLVLLGAILPVVTVFGSVFFVFWLFGKILNRIGVASAVQRFWVDSPILFIPAVWFVAAWVIYWAIAGPVLAWLDWTTAQLLSMGEIFIAFSALGAVAIALPGVARRLERPRAKLSAAVRRERWSNTDIIYLNLRNNSEIPIYLIEVQMEGGDPQLKRRKSETVHWKERRYLDEDGEPTTIEYLRSEALQPTEPDTLEFHLNPDAHAWFMVSAGNVDEPIELQALSEDAEEPRIVLG